MVSHSKFWTRNYADAVEWAGFRKKVYISAVLGCVAYSLGSAYFLGQRYDYEFCTEDFKRRVLGIGVQKQPPPGVVKELTEAEKEKLKILSEDDRKNNRNYKGANAFDKIRGRAYVPDKIDTNFLDGFQRPDLTVSTALYLESLQSPVSLWEELAPTLNIGDVVLLKGTGKMSWKIANLTYPWTQFDPWSLKYTHAGVIVDVDRSKNPPEVFMLEAVDNKDASLKDRDGQVRYQSVQVSNVRDRIFALRSEEDTAALKFQKSFLGKILYTFLLPPPTEEYNLYKRRCYSRACCRRLEGFDLTPEREELAKKFVKENVGRPMDKSPFLSLTQLDPSLYKREDKNAVSCTELIVDFYKSIGAVVDDRKEETRKFIEEQEDDLKHLVKPSITYIPYHFTPKGERSYPLSWTRRFTHLGPEEKILMNW